MISLITGVYKGDDWNEERTLGTIRDAALSLSGQGELIVVDCSAVPTVCVCELVMDFGGKYHWCQGYNIGYGGAINWAVQRMAEGEHVVYFSSKRGQLFAADWLDAITTPLSDPRCGMAGHLHECDYHKVAEGEWNSPEFHKYGKYPRPHMHVQGGVWAARREVLLKYPYTHRFPMVFSDVWISWRLLEAGYGLCEAHGIMAIPGGAIHNRHQYKYVVDYSTDRPPSIFGAL